MTTRNRKDYFNWKKGDVVWEDSDSEDSRSTMHINARSKEALDNARSAVETSGQQRAKSVDTDELSLLKEKTKLLGGY